MVKYTSGPDFVVKNRIYRRVIDVSFCVCFSKKRQDWKEFPFIKNTLVMIMSLGYGKLYYWDKLKNLGVRPKDNLKPEIDEVVKWA